jgi:NADH-quinone oxidoreductase subunit N
VSRYLALLPEFALGLTLGALFIVLLGRDAARRARRARLAAQLGGLAVLAACAFTLGATLDIFWLSYRVDAFSQLVKSAVALGFLLATTVIADGAGQRDDARGELYFFLVTSMAGLMVMASAVEALALYLALEIASFSLFVLVPLREGFPAGRESGLKFLLVGLGSSVVTLLGLAILIGLTGTTFIAEMALRLPSLAGHPALVFALGAFLAGFLFKLALFPFHFWAPDVYQGASHGVAAFVATASKMAAVAVLARLIALLGPNAAELAMALALAAAVSMTLGNLVAIQQRDLKRMLAYSAVAQAGYIVTGLVALSQDGLAAALFYAVLYLLMNAAAFLVVARVAPDGTNPSLDDLRGLHRRSPLLAATLLLALFALAGVPPTSGFIGKWFLFRAAMGSGWWWLVLLGAINATVSVYYYLVVVKHAYLLPAEEERPVRLTVGDKALCYGLSAAIVALGVYPTPVFDWARQAVAQLP